MTRTSDLRPQNLERVSCDVRAAGMSGRGVVLDRAGRVVTAGHVVGHVREVTVVLASGVVTMTVVKTSQHYDIALLEPISPLALERDEVSVLGEAAGTRPDTRYLACGPSDVGKYSTVISTGTISGRVGTSGEQPHYWQLNGDGLIRPGWSGTPLYDVDRNLVVGIVLETFTPPRGDSAPRGRAYAVIADVLHAEFGFALTEGVLPLRSVASSDAAIEVSMYGAPPLVRGPSFDGLDEQLAAAWDAHRQDDCTIVYIKGPKGSGKSTAVRRWLDDLPAGAVESIFWWTFSSRMPVEHFLGVLLTHLGAGDPGDSPAAQVAVAGALLRRRRTLLVLDDVDFHSGEGVDSVLIDLLDNIGAEGSNSFAVLIGGSTLRISSTGGFRQMTAPARRSGADDWAQVQRTIERLALDTADRLLLCVISVRSIPADIGDRLVVREYVLGEASWWSPWGEARPPDALTHERLKLNASQALGDMCKHGLLDDVSDHAYPAIPLLGVERYRVTPAVHRWVEDQMEADSDFARRVHDLAAHTLRLVVARAPRNWDDVVFQLEYLYHLIDAGRHVDAAEHIRDRDVLGTLFWRLEAWTTALDLIRTFFEDGDLQKRCATTWHTAWLRHASALCLINMGHHTQALRMVDLILADESLQVHQRSSTLLLAAELWAWRGDVPRARRLVTAAGAHAELSGLNAPNEWEMPYENFLLRECIRRDGWICLLEGRADQGALLLRQANDTDDLIHAESLDGVLWLAQAAIQVEQWNEAAEAADRLLDLDPLRADLRVGALAARASVTARGGSRAITSGARGQLDLAVVLARSCERPAALAQVLTTRGALTARADPTAALRDAEEALELTLRHNLLPGAVDARLVLVQLLRQRDPERARWELAVAAAEAEACGYARGVKRASVLQKETT